VEINGLRAVIVGGASGMARATATLLAEGGARIAIFDLPASSGKEVADELGGSFFELDITDEEGVETAVQSAAEALGGIDVGINVAGGGVSARTVSRKGPHSLEDFKRTIDLNLVATFNLLRLQADVMSRNDPNEHGERGVVINTASIAAFEGQIGQVAYAAAKSGIVGMTFVAARDLGSLGIRVNAIAPSLFDTGLTHGAPQEMKDALTADAAFPRRMGRPAEYAMLARSIIENPMLNGGTIRIDGGQRFAPK